MIAATCHCGAVRIEVPRRPRTLTDCNCSICRRYGTRWAYYKAAAVKVHAAARGTASYVWGGKSIRFVRCARCGCVTHWEAAKPGVTDRMGVNARNFDPADVCAARVRRLDGASTWKYLD